MPDQTTLRTTSSQPRGQVAVSAESIIDEARSFLTWWYVEMPTWYIGFLKRIVVLCDDTFSISILLKTFFVPWHRDENWIGYGFGIVMRILYLPLALIISGTILFIMLIITMLWAVLPFLSLIYLFRTPFL